MKINSKLVAYILILILMPFMGNAQTHKYKCLLQMNNYIGEGAYIVVSLISPQGQYEKTLYIMGEDKRWYNTLKEWHKYYSKKKNIDAKTGASVTGGDRSITTLEIEDSKIDKGYKLRFETAVEDQNYYVKDLEIPLTSQAFSGKISGTGYINYVRLSKIQ
ncbi:MAG: DUF2271 domain-containing protein [Apibacter sp.]|jgi:hypothetical protein|uniref:DUF2271 domain-containing protein n=1 Tax=Apibacter mensalis TaxID=1586267 RepID=A0A0X3AQI4_9FLAO|nr:DUF2271 domain-containing protein [Apibacter sp.]CVK16118.1 Predicted protein (DUF2271) [Apibacter mensalis]